MKQSHYEILRRKQLEYHRYHPWRLSERGLHIPYSFEDLRPGASSTWDDVGFILNGRRIIVWWQHPRHIYSNAINKKAWEEVGDGPRDNWLTEGGTKTWSATRLAHLPQSKDSTMTCSTRPWCDYALRVSTATYRRLGSGNA